MKKYILIVIAILVQLISVKAQTVTGIVTDSNGVRLAGLTIQLFSRGKIVSASSNNDGSFSLNIATDVKDESLPNGYAISNNYPNPFNPKTRLNFTLSKASHIRIEIFNITGQRVREITEANFGSGSNHIDLELNGLPNGLYFARLTIDGSYTVTKKLMLLYGSQHLSSAKISSNEKVTKSNSDIFIDSLIISGSYIVKTKINPPSFTAGNTLDLGIIKVKKLPDPPYSACPGIPTVIYAGKTYNTVQIGTLCWLKENLDIGTMIKGKERQTNNSIIEKYCFDNDTANCTAYGGLYQWAEAVQYKNGATNTTFASPALTGNIQGICPAGWHIPAKNEFDISFKKYSLDANALKAIGQAATPGAVNASGFSALLAGFWYSSGLYFNGLGVYADFWSSTEDDAASNANHMALNCCDRNIFMSIGISKFSGNSIRCVKD